jgi:hypothetical protein
MKAMASDTTLYSFRKNTNSLKKGFLVFFIQFRKSHYPKDKDTSDKYSSHIK